MQIAPTLSSLTFHIGTIGFSYPGWQNTFYPRGTRSGELLPAYASAFDAVELDTTFYGSPLPDRIKKWADAVPPNFHFSPKTPRQITHDTPLAETHIAMRQFVQALQPMHAAGKLGPILIQFPPTFTSGQHDTLHRFLAALPTGPRYAIELRHRSWERDQTTTLLKEHRCAWVSADYSTKTALMPLTADFLYLRLVGQHKFFPGDDREVIDPTDRLTWWIDQLRNWLPTLTPGTHLYTLISNDIAGHAPATANRFRTLLGIPPRLPIPTEKPPAQGSLF